MPNRVSHAVCVTALAIALSFGSALRGIAEETDKKLTYSKEKFLAAALENCSVVQNRAPASCKCEQQIIEGDRLTEDDKKMAFYYWTDKLRFKKEFESRRAADAAWQKGFSDRFMNMQALVMAACTRR